VVSRHVVNARAEGRLAPDFFRSRQTPAESLLQQIGTGLSALGCLRFGPVSPTPTTIKTAVVPAAIFQYS
jgi:hypothetical protein